MSRKVYLAGPISGLSYDKAESWRQYVKDNGGKNIEWFSPLRQQEHLKNHRVLHKTHFDGNPMTTKNGIMTRDAWDVQTSDLILCNVLGAEEISIGTVLELGMAYALRNPVVLVMETEGNLHEHVMIDNAWVFRTDTLDNGIQLVKDILLP